VRVTDFVTMFKSVVIGQVTVVNFCDDAPKFFRSKQHMRMLLFPVLESMQYRQEGVKGEILRRLSACPLLSVHIPQRESGHFSFPTGWAPGVGITLSVAQSLVGMVHDDILAGNVASWVVPGSKQFSGVTVGACIRFWSGVEETLAVYEVVNIFYFRHVNHAWARSGGKLMWQNALPKAARALTELLCVSLPTGDSRAAFFARQCVHEIFRSFFSFNDDAKAGLIALILKPAPVIDITDATSWCKGDYTAANFVPESIELPLLSSLMQLVSAEVKTWEIRIGFQSSGLATLGPGDLITFFDRAGQQVRVVIVSVHLFRRCSEFIDDAQTYYRIFPDRTPALQPHSKSAFEHALRSFVCNNAGFNRIQSDKLDQADQHGWVLFQIKKYPDAAPGVVWTKRDVQTSSQKSALQVLSDGFRN
jgi:hypothetical protein